MSGALCIRYGRTLLLLCKKMRRDRPRTGTGISRFGKARCFASARGQPPSTGRPNRRQRNSRSAGPSLFRVPSGGIFSPRHAT
ncbi:hypothetical protein ASJ35_11870 [Ruthenibacterium lactatiformans]|uniref:Uncharacterized protein n=1 Tax=Ruthenibacterium lactatiformans TaxID=1550024 RepID=A0A0W7TPG7_9FIRM|nr:hypothetical protein ASJ35_11870 [Ruthenibacterium lactatiformans]